MSRFDPELSAFIGEHGKLPVQQDDEIARKIAMLIEGECDHKCRTTVAQKFGFTRQRYYQIRETFIQDGASGLENKPRGPQTRYRATIEVVRQVIRYRFMEQHDSAQVIAQKLNQTGWTISTRSVERIIQEYGLQKKTP